MWKKLFLPEVSPLKAFEQALLRERDKFCSENRDSLKGHVRIVIKRKKVIDRGN